MRYLAAFLFLTTPVCAQTPVIAPAPSVLFHSASVAAARDSIDAGVGKRQRTGSIIGFLVGGGLGWAVVASSQGGCGTVDYAGGGGGGGACGRAASMPRVVGAIVGGFAGVIIGSIIAGPDTPAGR